MSLWDIKNERLVGRLFKTYDYIEYEYYRVQRDILLYRLMKYRPDLIAPEFHKELSAHPLHLIALEKRYVFLSSKLNKPPSMMDASYNGAGLHLPGVRFFLRQYGTKEAIQQFPWE